jgi:hypothetical protein
MTAEDGLGTAAEAAQGLFGRPRPGFRSSSSRRFTSRSSSSCSTSMSWRSNRPRGSAEAPHHRSQAAVRLRVSRRRAVMRSQEDEVRRVRAAQARRPRLLHPQQTTADGGAGRAGAVLDRRDGHQRRADGSGTQARPARFRCESSASPSRSCPSSCPPPARDSPRVLAATRLPATAPANPRRPAHRSTSRTHAPPAPPRPLVPPAAQAHFRCLPSSFANYTAASAKPIAPNGASGIDHVHRRSSRERTSADRSSITGPTLPTPTSSRQRARRRPSSTSPRRRRRTPNSNRLLCFANQTPLSRRPSRPLIVRSDRCRARPTRRCSVSGHENVVLRLLVWLVRV